MVRYFFLRGDREFKSIYLRIRDGQEIDARIATGLVTVEKKWDKKRSWPKKIIGDLQNDQLISDLEGLLKKVEKYEFGPGKDLPRNTKWLKEAIIFDDESNQETLSLIESIKKYVQFLPYRNSGVKKGVAPGTLRNFNTTIGRLTKYEDYSGKEISLTDLSFDFHNDYIRFATNNLDLSINSIGKDIKNIKAVCNDARDRGIKVNDNVFSRRFNVPKEKTHFVTLLPEEIDKIITFSGAKYLENAKDWLVIGCWTGARVFDLMSFNTNNLVEHKGRQIIKYTQSKTGKIVHLAIHPQVSAILERRNGQFPSPISDVKFNSWIKEVCEKVGIDNPTEGIVFDPKEKRKKRGIFPKYKFVRSHICRRSFATNHYGKIATNKLMAATGHSTERMLLLYIGETEEDHVDDFINLYS